MRTANDRRPQRRRLASSATRRRKARNGARPPWRLHGPRDELLLRAKARISCSLRRLGFGQVGIFDRLGAPPSPAEFAQTVRSLDRKSTRLNSSHLVISYAVFCLKKKKKIQTHPCFSKKKKNKNSI